MSPEAQRSGKEGIDRCIGLGPRRLGEARGGASCCFAIFRTFFHKYHSIFVRSNSLFSSINSYLYAKIFASLFHSVQGMPLLREYNLELPPPFETVLVFGRLNFES
jgi:hypothetical protein